MEHTLKMTYRLCKAKRLVVNPQKTNIMIFTKKYKPETIKPLRPERQEIAFTNTVKYWEVLLDPKLNWKQHLIDRKKFYSSIWVPRRAMGKTSVCVSGLVAHTEQGGDKESAAKPTRYLPECCNGVQENYTHRGTGSSPLPDSSGSSCHWVCRTSADRLKCQPEWRNMGLGHTKLEFLQKYPFTLNQDRIPKTYQLVKPFKTRIPTRQDWQMPDKIIDTNTDLWFKDGSGIHDCFGVGIYEPLYNYMGNVPFHSNFCQSDGYPKVYRTPPD